MRIKYNPRATLCVAAIAFLSATAPAARADVTVVTETTTELDLSGVNKSDLGDLKDFGKPLTISIAYSKGKLSRYDTPERIILCGLQEGTISILNPADRTYYVTTESQEYARVANVSDSPLTGGEMASLNPTTTVTPIPGRRMIAGLPARGIHYAIDIDVKFPKGAADVPDYLRLSVDGDIWSSPNSPNVPGDISSSKMPAAVPTPMRKALTEISDKLQGNPLNTTLVFHLAAGDKGQKIRMNVVMHQNTRAISHTPLADDLFRVPDGYRLVPPPAKPAPPADNKPAPADSEKGPPAMGV